MKNSTSIKIQKWKKKHGLTRKSLYLPLLESYRRVHMFHAGDVNSDLSLLALPSEVKEVKGVYVEPSLSETPRAFNWYKLTLKGQEVVNDLTETIGWNEDEMNVQLFELV